jgi:UDP-2,3-diacylglucosamine pyrophosphatase LpxH
VSSKAKIIVSDLHLGAGRVAEGNLLEDFDSDDAFYEFMQSLIAESDRAQCEMELILAGDTFEFLQVPALEDAASFDPSAHYASEEYAPSSEAASVAKMALMVAGHSRFFAGLRAFILAAPPFRRVTFIKGNHDINLHWAGVQQALRVALGGSGPRAACVSFEERRITREGLYVEHGSQYGERANRFPDFEEPHDMAHPEQLHLPPGSAFVLSFFNTLEREHYWMDGVKPITALIWYTFALDFGLAVRALYALLRELPSLTWGNLPPEWGVTTYLEAHEHLVAELEEIDDAKRVQALERDLGALRDFYRRAAFALALYGVPSRAAEPPAAEGVRDYAVLPRALAEERAQRAALVGVAARKVAQENARVVVFGHTHEATVERLDGDAVYLNSGAWTWARDFSGEDFTAWKRLFKNPEQFTQERRLSYVRVDYDAQGQPSAQLLTFQRPERERGPLWRGLLRRLLGGRRRP